MEKDPRINERIRAKEVRLIDADSKQLGIMAVREALRLAEERDLDLVEVAPDAKPPVCKIMDFGKYKYQMSKKQTQKKTPDVKEIKLRPRIGEHDLLRKVNKIKEFLAEGHKIKVSMFFRGRERGRPDLGMKVFDRLLELLDVNYNVVQKPIQMGNSITMVIVPK